MNFNYLGVNSYSAESYGLKEELDGTWIFRRTLLRPLVILFPGVLLFAPSGKAYRLTARVGRAVQRATFRSVYWSKECKYIYIFGFLWFLVPLFLPNTGAIRGFMKQHLNEVLEIGLISMLLIQNCILIRIARFCQKVGVPVNLSK